MNDDELDKELKARGLDKDVRDDERTVHFFARRTSVDEGNEDLETFFRDLVKAYINYPSYLKLEFKEARFYWTLAIEPDVSDYAIVAGKMGRNFNALRTLVEAISQAQKIQIELSLNGPEKNDDRYIRQQLPYRPNRDWRPDTIKSVVSRALRLAGLRHVKLLLERNRVVNESNPFDDQAYYWFAYTRNEKEVSVTQAIGQLLESMGMAQGQRLSPKPRSEIAQFEKTA